MKLPQLKDAARPGARAASLRDLTRWLVLVLVALVLLFGCGQLALWRPVPPVSADTRSQMRADYSAWTDTLIHPVDPRIVHEVARDDGELPEVRPGVFWPAQTSAGPTQLVAGPGGAPSTSPAQPPGLATHLATPAAPAASATPPGLAGSETASTIQTGTQAPTSSATWTRTATQSATFTRTATRTYAPAATLTPWPSPTPYRTPTPATFPPWASSTPAPTLGPGQTSTPAPTSTATATTPATATSPASATPPPTNTPAASPTFTATPPNRLTLVPTGVSSPTPTPVPTYAQISGRVFEDTNYAGGAGTAFGAGDAGLAGVTVEFYSGGMFRGSTTTGASGYYTWNSGGPGTYTVRVVSLTAGGAAGALPEQSFERNGIMGNGGAGALGGNDPDVDDRATGPGAGPGDTSVTVSLGGSGLSGVDFGFVYHLVVNTKDAGQGSLRQALLNSNQLSGLGTVVFNLAGAGPFTIRPGSALPALADAVVVDGSTQPGYAGAPLIEIDGSAAGPGVSGLVITAGGSTIRGLAINGFSGSGISLAGGSGNRLEGNYLGTDLAGLLAAPNAQYGVSIVDSANNIVGGTTAAQRNLVSGNIGGGVLISGSLAVGNQIAGNHIGADVTGAGPLGNTGDGVRIDAASGSTIGGLAPGAGNVISANGGAGIHILAGTRNTFLSNSLAANGGLGIDLDLDGVTANNGTKGSALANQDMDQPVFTAASLDAGTLTVSGYVGSAAGQAEFGGATVQVFQVEADGSGYGEGSTLLGTLAADAYGSVQGSLAVSNLAAGDRITGTATDAEGNTSEFGLNTVVAAARVTAGLQALYTFEEAGGATVGDVSGVGAPLDLTVANPDRTSWMTGGLSVDAATILTSSGPAAKIIAACQASSEITVEAWVKPANTTQNGPARIVTLSADTNLRNFTLGQGDGASTPDLYLGRLRTTQTSLNGMPSLDTANGSLAAELTHVVYTRAADGTATLYVRRAGVSIATTTTVGGDFSTWDAGYVLALANELTLNRAWLGEYHLVAIYSRALSSSEVAQNYAAGPD